MEEASLIVGGVNRGRPKKNVKKDANLQGIVGDYNSLNKAQIFLIFLVFLGLAYICLWIGVFSFIPELCFFFHSNSECT